MAPKRRLAVGVVLGVLFLGALIAVNIARVQGRRPQVETAQLERRDLLSVITSSAQIRPARYIDLSSPLTGRLELVRVREGEPVKAGQLLAHLTPARADVDTRAEASALQAQRHELRQAEAELEAATLQYQRAQQLDQAQLISRTELETAASAYKSRSAAAAALRDRVAQRQAVLAGHERDLAQATLVATMDGIVTRQHHRVGELLQPYQPVLTVADPGSWSAEALLPEADIRDVRAGQPVSVRVETLGLRLPGTVSEVAAAASAAGEGELSGVRFRVVATLNGTLPALRDGLQATLAIMTARRTQALALPLAALVRLDGRDGVFLLERQRAIFTAVKTGVSSDTHVELLEGLDEGATVVVGPYKALRALEDRELVRARPAHDSATALAEAGEEFAGAVEAPMPAPNAAAPPGDVAQAVPLEVPVASPPALTPAPSPTPDERAARRLIVPIRRAEPSDQVPKAPAPAAFVGAPKLVDLPGPIDPRLFLGAMPRPAGDRLAGDGGPCVLEDSLVAHNGALLLRLRLQGAAGRHVTGSLLASGRLDGILATDEDRDLRVLAQLAPGARGPLVLGLDGGGRYTLERLP